MSEQWISNSGELEATMAGIYEKDSEMDVPCPGEIYFDEDGIEWLMGEDGQGKRID